MERPTQREPDLRVAVPAEVDGGALGREQVERPLEAGGRRAGVHDQVAAVGGFGAAGHPGADDRDPVADQRGGVPQRLVRVQAEDRAAAQLGRPLLDRADVFARFYHEGRLPGVRATAALGSHGRSLRANAHARA